MAGKLRRETMGGAAATAAMMVYFLLLAVAAAQAQPQPQPGLSQDAATLLSIKAQLVASDANATAALGSWNSSGSSVCSWGGVQCGMWQGESRVTGLMLQGLDLDGVIPADIARLSALAVLDLSQNLFKGSIPMELGSCSNLQVLDVSYNALNGSFPVFLSTLPNLQSMDLSQNSINGSLPEAFISSCPTGLQELRLSGIGLTGPMAADIGIRCSSLQALDLSLNLLEGQVPASLGLLPDLRSVSLQGNLLSGIVPPPFFNCCSTLQELDLSYNELVGPIPDDLRWCTKLTSLILQGNGFNGSIPHFLSSLTSLQVVSLGANLLTGSLTDQFSGLANLTFLEVHNNYLTGPHPGPYLANITSLKVLAVNVNPFDADTIWPGLGMLPELEYLDMSHTTLEGSIPWQLGNLTKLDHLLLSGNNLTGDIPAELSGLSQLLVMDLGYNQLTGTIPASFSQMQELMWLNLRVNSITGPLPPELSNCSSLLWFNAFTNNINGSIPDSWYMLGSGAVDRFMKNRQKQHIFPAYVGECSMVARWVPGQITSTIEENLRHDRCKSYWNVLLQGYAVVNPCSWIKPTQGYLELAENQLTGSIPGSLGNASNLGYIYLQRNQLSGSIPDTFSDLPLSRLSLQHNLLSGEMPSSLGQLECLISLDLSFNNLSGQIPPSLGTLSFLTQFNVSYNVYLTGPIPTGTQFFTFGLDAFIADCDLQVGDIQNFRQSNFSTAHIPGCSATIFPTPPPQPSPGAYRSGGRGGASNAVRLSTLAIVGISLAGTFTMLFLGACSLVMLMKKQRALSSHQSEVSFAKVERDSQIFASRLKTHVSIFKMSLPTLTYEDLVVATSNFDEANVLGSGGFGCVYKAQLADGSVVAIKKLTQDGPQGIREFKAEMETLGRIKHENLVPLLGYCSFQRERILVYQCMKNGSLEEWLHEKENGKDLLVWHKRLKIAIGTARGLDFLHNKCSPLIIHRDMKASNILLDEFFNAHVTDFGLARLVDVDATHVSTTIAGTLGYVPPEYSQTWRATVKGDVYSFGVVLLELATGKRPVGVYSRDNKVGNLVEWVRLLLKLNRHTEALDPVVVGTGPTTSDLHNFLHLAISCCEESVSKRPNMADIVTRLQEMQAGPDHLLHDILEE